MEFFAETLFAETLFASLITSLIPNVISLALYVLLSLGMPTHGQRDVSLPSGNDCGE